MTVCDVIAEIERLNNLANEIEQAPDAPGLIGLYMFCDNTKKAVLELISNEVERLGSTKVDVED